LLHVAAAKPLFTEKIRFIAHKYSKPHDACAPCE
jgi:hypothetical protein